MKLLCNDCIVKKRIQLILNWLNWIDIHDLGQKNHPINLLNTKPFNHKKILQVIQYYTSCLAYKVWGKLFLDAHFFLWNTQLWSRRKSHRNSIYLKDTALIERRYVPWGGRHKRELQFRVIPGKLWIHIETALSNVGCIVNNFMS